jgi:hypothetical protein
MPDRSLEEMLSDWEREARMASDGPWRTRYGGNFTQVWEITTDMSQPSERLIADINFRKSNVGEQTPVMSRLNARYIAFANPSFALNLIAAVRSALSPIQGELPPLDVTAEDGLAAICAERAVTAEQSLSTCRADERERCLEAVKRLQKSNHVHQVARDYIHISDAQHAKVLDLAEQAIRALGKETM